MSTKKSFLSTLFQGKPKSDCCEVTYVENDASVAEEDAPDDTSTE